MDIEQNEDQNPNNDLFEEESPEVNPGTISRVGDKPDEGEGKLEVEVVDDTPEQDRGRKPLGKDALAEIDDEAEQYTAKVKKRMGELRHQAHDERRAKEAAQRERDEALRMAQATYQRAKELERRLTQGELSYAQQVAQQAEFALEAAKAKHQKAFEANDPEAMADAIAQMAEAKAQALNAQRWAQDAEHRVKNPVQDDENDVDSAQHSRQQQQAVQQAKPDPRAVEWADKNKWFGTDEAMTSLAYGVHAYLVREVGLDPQRDAAKYYAAIDREMRRRFPEYEWEDEVEKPRTSKKSSQPVVAPVARVASGSKNKVVLSKTQVAMAEKMGLTLEQYARELQKLNQGA